METVVDTDLLTTYESSFSALDFLCFLRHSDVKVLGLLDIQLFNHLHYYIGSHDLSLTCDFIGDIDILAIHNGTLSGLSYTPLLSLDVRIDLKLSLFNDKVHIILIK